MLATSGSTNIGKSTYLLQQVIVILSLEVLNSTSVVGSNENKKSLNSSQGT